MLHAYQPGRDQGCRRRPKTKYDVGTTPAELTSATTGAHIHFRPRIWLAGCRWMSMSAATRRAPSATAIVTSSMRVRLLRSLHRRLAATTSSSVRSPATCAAISSSASSSCLRTSAGKSSSCVTPVPLPSPATCAAICSSASSSCLRTSAGKSSSCVTPVPLPSPATCAAICSSASSSCLRTSAGKSSLSSHPGHPGCGPNWVDTADAQPFSAYTRPWSRRSRPWSLSCAVMEAVPPTSRPAGWRSARSPSQAATWLAGK